ncbi:MAG: hypothetical protein ACE5GW_03530 [Planctomycetota bacterium]
MPSSGVGPSKGEASDETGVVPPRAGASAEGRNEEMPGEIEVTVNGNPAEITVDPDSASPSWDELLAALESELSARGWKIGGIRLDGRDVRAGDRPEISEGSHQVEVSAIPDSASLEELENQLFTSLPRLREGAEEIADAITRGEWQEPLERLLGLLDEITSSLAGSQALAAARGEELPAIVMRLPEVLRSITGPIAEASWVDVADTLRHELAPILEEWERDESCRRA